MERLERLQNLLLEDANNSFLHFAIAKEHEAQKNLNLALEHFIFIVDHEPNYLGVYYHLAQLYIELKEIGLAKETLSKGIKLSQQIKDHHAESELKGLLMNLLIEE